MEEYSETIVISRNTDASNMEKSALFHATKDGRLASLDTRQRMPKEAHTSYFGPVH